jgi:hypothetical protein
MKKKKLTGKNEGTKCDKCYGYGWWPIGDLVPLGPMDGSDFGPASVKCPWCGAGNKKNDKYKLLLKAKLDMEKNKIK